jgi:hypothetical protein
VHVGVDLAAAAVAHLPPGAAARFLVTAFNSTSSKVFTGVYVIGEFAAPPIMAFALWRSRSVPRWLAVLFPAAVIAAEVMPSLGPVVLLYTLPFVVVMVLLAARIWQAAARPHPAAATTRTPPPAPGTAPGSLLTTPGSGHDHRHPAHHTSPRQAGRRRSRGRPAHHGLAGIRRRFTGPLRLHTTCLPRPPAGRWTLRVLGRAAVAGSGPRRRGLTLMGGAVP